MRCPTCDAAASPDEAACPAGHPLDHRWIVLAGNQAGRATDYILGRKANEAPPQGKGAEQPVVPAAA